jgi:cytoskeletal protein CcmA (bactofilin family)
MPQEATQDVSVISAGVTVTGNIEALVDLHIQGRVRGDVRCATLLLGEGSEVLGNVIADRVRVGGSVEGSVETKDLAIEATAKVTGDVTYARLRIANGAVVHGQLRHHDLEEEVTETGRLRLVDEDAPLRAQAVHIE